jgi:uncharacterized DUF497 family protein
VRDQVSEKAASRLLFLSGISPPDYPGFIALLVTTKRVTIETATKMKYEWDEAKNRKNFVKHGLSFEDAARVFDGPCVTFEDDRFAYGEERLVTLGLLAGRLVVITHSPRDEGTRVISMRKGNRREQKIYQERLGAN